MFKKKSKSVSSWNSIKEFEQGEDEFEEWKACKTIMVSKEAKVSAKEVTALTTWAYSSTHPRVKFRWKWWGPKWEKKDEAPCRRAKINV